MKMALKTLKNLAIAASIGLASLTANYAKAEPLKETPSYTLKINNIEQTLLLDKPLKQKMTLIESKTIIKDAPSLLPKDAWETKIPAYKQPLEWLIIGGESAASWLTTVLIHETGHAIVASSLGVGIERFHPYPEIRGNTFLGGYISFTEDINDVSKAGRIAISSGGMLTTRLTAEGLDLLMNQVEMPARAEQGLATLYFMTRLDMTRYVLSCAIKSWANRPAGPISDPQRIMDLLTFERKERKSPEEKGKELYRKNSKAATKQKLIYAGAAGLLALDTFLDWDELKDNWDRLWLKDPRKKEPKRYEPSIQIIPEGFMLSVKYNL